MDLVYEVEVAMFRLDRVLFAAPLLVISVVMLLASALVAGDSGLPPGGSFFDDDGNVHEPNIEAIAAAGITKGCNPPVNTLYCPGASVTRGQMAAFLRRALVLPGSAVDAFTDDDGTVFEDDINAIAAAGITKGCNPPANTLYCPAPDVIREQMASFLGRALGLSPINPPPYIGFNSPVAAFASHEVKPLLGDSPSYAGPATPTSLTGISMSDWVAARVADPEIAAHLAEHGFVVVPEEINYTLFHWIYDTAPYQGHPVFVTADAAYNVWHLVFDKILRDMETNVLLPELESLVLGMLDAARAQTADLATTPLSDHALRIEEWFEAAATLLELDVGPIGSRAQAEVNLVLAHSAKNESPTMGFQRCTTNEPTCVSYAMFKPRGHYTRSEELQRFFRVMSMFGQTPFPTTGLDEMRLASLLAGLLAADSDLKESWELIYDPTAFLVGLADDYTPYDLAAVVNAEVATGFTDSLAFVPDSTIEAVAEGLHELRPIVIDPERPSVRFMGSRATLDAFILDQLVDPTIAHRHDASALDVAAAFGSDLARSVQLAGGAESFPAYVSQQSRLRNVVAGRTDAQWAATVYDAWLSAIQVMWVEKGAAYPDFMQTDAWATKALQTGLGSYAELKHDTILYVKPAFAEGEGPPEPEVPPRHWVEPEPVAFQRLAAAANLMGNGLDDRGLLPDEYELLISDLVVLLDRLAGLAEDELAGKPISEADNEWLGRIGPQLESFWLRTADYEDGMPSELDEEAAIVADIVTTLKGALEVATGRIDPILVLLPNDAGDFQVTVGGVYSYYEFWQAPSNRLTDEEWRAMLAEGTEPDRPWWQDILFAP